MNPTSANNQPRRLSKPDKTLPTPTHTSPNRFTFLRDEISTLRSEFSKMKAQEHTLYSSPPQNTTVPPERSTHGPERLSGKNKLEFMGKGQGRKIEARVGTHSTIGLDSKRNQRAGNCKEKEGGERWEKGQSDQTEESQWKKYRAKIRALQEEVTRLREALENVNEIRRRQKELEAKMEDSELRIVDLRRELQESSISLNLKSILVEKLEEELEQEKINSRQRHQAELDSIRTHYEEQINKLTAEQSSQVNTVDQDTHPSVLQNSELKKRVQSYRKTVEKLNSAHNSEREKIVVLREEVRRLKEENRLVQQESQVKQTLITSLYRDIALLDRELRSVLGLKAIFSSQGQLVSDLNGKVLQLECRLLSHKYQNRFIPDSGDNSADCEFDSHS